MNTNTVLNKVRELLGMQIELEQRKLDDGVTVVEADAFEVDAEIFIVTEDEQKIALPVGEYKLEDGMMLVVKEEGKIAEVKEEEEAEEEKKEEEETEAGYDDKEEEMAEEKKPVKKTVESIVKETFFTEIEALKKENEDLKAEIELLSKNKTEEVETEAETVELSDQNTEDLEPAVEPISHNPENIEEKEVFKFNANRPKTLLDSIFEKINK
jgi:putative cell wall-binding protein